MAAKPHKDDSLVAYLLDALAALPGLRSKSMFGGFGLQSEDAFFGIVSDGAAYFKVDDLSRPQYVAHGAEPFMYGRGGKSMTMGYFTVPADIVEDYELLLVWAQEAIRVSRRAKAAKPRPKTAIKKK